MESTAKINEIPNADGTSLGVSDAGKPANDSHQERIAWAEEEQIRFGLLLVDKGECSIEQLQAALWASSSTKDSIVDSLTAQGVIRHERLIELMQEAQSDQIATTIRFDVPVPDKSFLEDEKVVIFGLSTRTLYLGCLGDQNLVERYFSRLFPRHGIRFMPVKPEVVEKFLSNLDLLPHTSEERTDYGRFDLVRYVPEQIADSEVLDILVNLAGVLGASDIHVEPKAKSYTVFIRKDRLRRIIHEGNLKQYAAVRAQVKVRAGMDQLENRKPGDGKFTKQIMGRMFDLRVATVPTVYVGLEKITLRLLDPDRASLPLVDLGLSKIDLFREATRFPYGVFLISGKTNSGKTTTLTASLREEDRLGRSCYTIEDPVENRLEFVTQIPINRSEDVNLDFEQAIRAVMRSDGEVLVVGEVRDRETANAMAMAAETGMFVFATTHSGSVAETPGRLKRLGVGQDSLRSLLRGILSQRLVRKVCSNCATQEVRGCQVCSGSGYRGMTLVSEIAMTSSEEEVDALYDRKLSFEPFAIDALRKLDLGIVDEREIYRAFSTELRYPDKAARDFPGVIELHDRVMHVINNPKLRKPIMPAAEVTTLDAGLDVHARRVAHQLEEQLRTVSVEAEPASGWSNFMRA